MTRLPSPRGPIGSVAPMLVLVLVVSILAACSSTEPGPNGTTSPGGGVASTLPAEGITPQELATAVADTYVEGMQELVATLESRPDPASALPQVQALKEEYIQRLLALARQRETLGEAERAQVDSILWRTLPDLATEDWYTDYNAAWTYYQGIDLELANLVASCNILTQYADLELLKTQSPEEAARLGIE